MRTRIFPLADECNTRDECDWEDWGEHEEQSGRTIGKIGAIPRKTIGNNREDWGDTTKDWNDGEDWGDPED